MLRDVLNVLAGRVTKRVLLHAYSGRRRSGDLQCYLEAIEVPDGLVCHVISLDIVVSETHGNIMVSSGYGVLEADGCNVASRVRHAKRGLRGVSMPWTTLMVSMVVLVYYVQPSNPEDSQVWACVKYDKLSSVTFFWDLWR